MRSDVTPDVIEWARDGLPALTENQLIRAHRCCCHGGQPVDETVDWPPISELEQQQRLLAQATLTAEARAAEKERTA